VERHDSIHNHAATAMHQTNLLDLFWEGFQLIDHQVLGDQQLLITLEARSLPRCSSCGKASERVHDTHLRRVRERNLFDHRVWLEVPVRRVSCVRCGVRVEQINWLDGRRHMTVALRCYVETLVRILPIKHVADHLELHWHTVKRIDKQRLLREVVEPDRNRLRWLLMDEFALHKGHRYATVVSCAETQQIIWIGEGRSRQAIRPFFVWLGAACARIEAVAMDMNTAFDLEVQQHCPQAAVVYDLFHVVAKFGREVIDRVRVDQANQLREDRPARRVIKRSRWLLLRNHQNLTEEQAVRLDELLAANQPLTTVYLLKAQLKELWYAPNEAIARQRWREWYRLAMESGLKPLITFARRLKPYLEGIITSARFRLQTSVLEGMNNRIKVIKRMAYGYRDTDYFFLKIRAAFPGKVR
jgi:transposase